MQISYISENLQGFIGIECVLSRTLALEFKLFKTGIPYPKPV